ncbi:hypothetical protein PRUPE_4G070600 [Prunus persica]|uniref:GDSL esterase/lipase n=1 Tax=Prunus persica TaxID=3760 RepID=A0A251PGX3_PRUPE|nr:GDSL esterase/lipase At1g29670 [Prunus persica]ONI10833.1 hypothetical protein PRUPE_4G070600 [Prunus persica]
MATNYEMGVRWFKMILGVLVFSILLSQYSCVYGEAPQVPCFFIFGDSLVDSGNNNYLPTLAKVNYLPYGVDFPIGATGRFCNGRTSVDILAELLGFKKPIPPFATTWGLVILRGLNYASGASGIRAESGTEMGVNVNLEQQLRNHHVTVLRIASILRHKALALKYLNKCFYFMGIGNNDYINNYFQTQYFNTSRIYTLEQYASVLIEQYSQQIMTLYRYGARKVALVGVAPIGNATEPFNEKLRALVDKLNADLEDAQFIYVNSSSVSRPADFKVPNISCCAVNELGLCNPFEPVCQNRSDYALWDSFHPTEAANIASAGRAYSSQDPSDTYPMDISHLVQLSL